MSDLDVRADGEHRYAATTTAPDGTTARHEVLSHPELLAELGLGPAEEPLLVRRALEELVRAADRGAGAATGGLPAVIDLRLLHEEHPELLRSLTLRTAL